MMNKPKALLSVVAIALAVSAFSYFSAICFISSWGTGAGAMPTATLVIGPGEGDSDVYSTLSHSYGTRISYADNGQASFSEQESVSHGSISVVCDEATESFTYILWMQSNNHSAQDPQIGYKTGPCSGGGGGGPA